MKSGTRETFVSATVRGRCLTLPAHAAEETLLLAGFHGYGESAEHMLAQLATLPGGERWSRSAIQALHPFYNSRTGEVVASWMTRLDREQAINDNLRYVSDAVASLRAGRSSSVPLAYLGFSQGVAMAYRAAALCGHPCCALVALAGDVPPELTEEELGSLPPVLIAHGHRDEWYTQDKLRRDVDRLEAAGASVDTFVFEGGHEWSDAFRRRCADFLERFSSR